MDKEKPARQPRDRNLNGQVPVPRSWTMGESWALSDRAFRLHCVMLALVDWDPRHVAGYGRVKLAHSDLPKEAKGWSRDSFFRATRELIDAGHIERVRDGEYALKNLDRFLIGKAVKWAAERERRRVADERLGVAGQRLGVAPERQTVAPQQLKREFPEGDSPAKNLSNSKKESTGDPSFCELLTWSKRNKLAKDFPELDVERNVQEYHAAKSERGIPCSAESCQRIPCDLAQRANDTAKNNPSGYYRSCLNESVEKQTDDRSARKESHLLRRPAADDAGAILVAAGDIAASFIARA